MKDLLSQQRENKEKIKEFVSTVAFGGAPCRDVISGDASEFEETLEGITASTWHAAQREVVERVREAIDKLPDHYPIDLFPDPWEGWQKDIDELAKSKGERLDLISGWYGRWAKKNVVRDLQEELNTFTRSEGEQ